MTSYGRKPANRFFSRSFRNTFLPVPVIQVRFAEEYIGMIDIAVAKLPPQQQKVYKLSRYNRLKHEEIAELLGLSPER